MGNIERDQLAPFFQIGEVGSGVESTVELLVSQALNHGEDLSVQGKIPSQKTNTYSGGGGAKIDVAIGSSQLQKSADPQSAKFPAQPSPKQALVAYMNVLRLKIKDPNLELYTPETRAFLQQWLVTDAQQMQELAELEKSLRQMKTIQEQDLAVTAAPIGNSNLPPYFFRKQENGWMLDFASLGKLVSFNHKNQWRFNNLNHEFMFAFKGQEFDENGFPRN